MKPKVLVTEQVAIPPWTEHDIAIEYAPDLWNQPEKILGIIAAFNGIVVRNRTLVTSALIEHGKNLRIIGRLGTGVDNIDMGAAKRHGIPVINTPDANTDAVAEYCLAQMVYALRKLDYANRSTHNGQWDRAGCIGRELKEVTVGIMGYGHIGKRLHALLMPFGCTMLIASRHLKQSDAKGFTLVSSDELFTRADVISLHIEGGSTTNASIAAPLMEKMKKDIIFINTTRGDVVDEAALEKAALARPQATFILDVRKDEPPKDARFRGMDNVVLSPHSAAFTLHARKAVAEIVFQGVVSTLCDKSAMGTAQG